MGCVFNFPFCPVNLCEIPVALGNKKSIQEALWHHLRRHPTHVPSVDKHPTWDASPMTADATQVTHLVFWKKNNLAMVLGDTSWNLLGAPSPCRMILVCSVQLNCGVPRTQMWCKIWVTTCSSLWASYCQTKGGNPLNLGYLHCA